MVGELIPAAEMESQIYGSRKPLEGLERQGDNDHPEQLNDLGPGLDDLRHENEHDAEIEQRPDLPQRREEVSPATDAGNGSQGEPEKKNKRRCPAAHPAEEDLFPRNDEEDPSDEDDEKMELEGIDDRRPHPGESAQ